MRLIDADALLDAISVHLERIEQEFDDARTIDALPATIEGALGYLHKVGWMQEHDRIMTEDAAPVRHGRWEVIDAEEPRRYGCSECKRLSWYMENYCGNCGARMDEEE